jgi:putative membrane protein
MPEPAPTTTGADARIFAIRRPHPNLLKNYALKSLLALFFAPIVFLPMFFKYHTLRYRFDEEGVSASWGILFKREIYLTYKRIQDIHVRRNIVERWLGIGTVDVQTASGSSSAELSVEGMEDYEGVRDFLYRRMRGWSGDTAAAAGAGQAGPMTVGAVGAVGGVADERVVALLDEIRGELDGLRKDLAARGA